MKKQWASCIATTSPTACLEMRLRLPNGQTTWATTDSCWKVTDSPTQGWHTLSADDSSWLHAESRGRAPVFPWGAIER